MYENKEKQVVYNEYNSALADMLEVCKFFSHWSSPVCVGPDMFADMFSAATGVEMSGKGELVAFTTVHIAPTAMIEAGYGRKNPYCTGIVQLDEGPAISAQILGVDAARPQEIEIGMPLRVTFV